MRRIAGDFGPREDGCSWHCLAKGLALMIFSQATTLSLAIPLLVVFALFVKMSNGATFAVVPFVNRAPRAP